VRSKQALLLGGSLLVLASSSPAAEFREAARYALASNEVLRSELWVRARTIALDGVATDDLFLLADGSAPVPAGGRKPPAIRLSGTASNDVWALGENVLVDGAIGEHARLAGFKTVTLDGPVGRGALIVGNAVRVGEQAVIGGDLRIMAADIMVDGVVRGSATLRGATATLAGTVDGDVHVTANRITVMPGTRIGGDLVYLSAGELVLDPKVSLGGKLRRQRPAGPAPGQMWAAVMLQVGFCFGALLTGLVFLAVFPRVGALAARELETSFWKCLLAGAVAACLLPLIAFFLFVTLVGIPLSAMLACGYLILVYLGKIVAALHIGRLVLRHRAAQSPTLLAVLALGLLVVYAAGGLPFPIDIVAWIAFTCMGMGGLVIALLDRRPPEAEAPPPMPAGGGGRIA
jgi:cytoskeletal protein CcmA (bactofilin family)